MTTNERALELCDKIGITDPIERERFVWGYSYGSHDQLMKEIERAKDTVQHLLGSIPHKSIPDAETR